MNAICLIWSQLISAFIRQHKPLIMLMVLFRINQSFALFSLAREAQQCSVGFSHEYYFWHSDQPKLPSIQRLMQNLCWHYDSQQNLCWHWFPAEPLLTLWFPAEPLLTLWFPAEPLLTLIPSRTSVDITIPKSRLSSAAIVVRITTSPIAVSPQSESCIQGGMQHCTCMHDSTGNTALVCMKVQVHLCAWQHMHRCTCLHDGTCASALVCMTVHVQVHCKTIYAWQYNCKCTCMHDNICMIVQVQLHAWKYMCKCTCMHGSSCACALVYMTVHVKAHLYPWQYMCKHMKIVQESQICRKIVFFFYSCDNSYLTSCIN